MNHQDITVVKRDGRVEDLDLNKLHAMVEEACEGIAGVSASQVEINSSLSFYDGITTADIQQTLIRSASDLISLEHPNYQFVAARLLLFSLRKSINGRIWDTCTLRSRSNMVLSRVFMTKLFLTTTAPKSWLS